MGEAKPPRVPAATSATAATSSTAATGWHAARQLAADAVERLPAETIPLAGAVGRVTADEIRAQTDVPHYESSAMDGWAVRGPGPWSVVSAPAHQLEQGTAVATVTGGTIPRLTDAVLRSESGQLSNGGSLLSVEPASIALTRGEPRLGQHIRTTGTEARHGEPVIGAGVLLNPAHVALAAVCGHDQLTVTALPEVAVLLTGDEVVSDGIPRPGQVRDSFGPQLPHLLRMLGARATTPVRVPDDLTATISALTGCVGEVIVTTGGTGYSPADHLRPALSQLGAAVIVDHIAMRPGGPTCVARLPNGQIVVCLPGNPLAAMMGILTVLEPLLATLGGRPPRATTRVTAGRAVAGRAGTSILLPYRLIDGSAVAGDYTGSGMMRGLAEADGVMIVPASGVTEGGQADSLALPWAAASLAAAAARP